MNISNPIYVKNEALYGTERAVETHFTLYFCIVCIFTMSMSFFFANLQISKKFNMEI